MKRDMDLIRKILLAIEAHAEPYSWEVPIEIEGYSDKEVSYHIKLLLEAGLIEARGLKGTGVITWAINGLTWAGHEFLEASRDDSRWGKVKRLVIEKTGSLSFEVLKTGLIQAMAYPEKVVEGQLSFKNT